MEITAGQIQRIIPRTPLHKAVSYADQMNLLVADGIDTPRRLSAIFAQIAFMTKGLAGSFLDLQLGIMADSWRYRNMNALADSNDFRAISRVFSSNLDGYGARLLIYKQALRVLKAH